MFFSERQKLEKEYYKYLDKNKLFRGNLMHVLTFLDNNGNLVEKDDGKKIKVLKKALELACCKILSLKHKNIDFENYKPTTTIKHYMRKAEKLVEVKNEDIQIQGGIY